MLLSCSSTADPSDSVFVTLFRTAAERACVLRSKKLLRTGGQVPASSLTPLSWRCLTLSWVFTDRNAKMSHSQTSYPTPQSSLLLYVHRDRTNYQGRGARDGHLDFHTAPELLSSQWVSSVQCCFTSTETVGLLGTGSPGRPLRL